MPQNQSEFSSISEIMKIVNNKFTDCPDLIKKRVYSSDDREAYFIYMESLVDKDLVQRDFITPLLALDYGALLNEVYVKSQIGTEIFIINDINRMIRQIESGFSVFVCDGLYYAISCKLTQFAERSIEEPIVEKNVRGPHEGFVESLPTNISILRRKIKNSNLKFKMLEVGTVTHQPVVIAYIQGIANPDLLNTLYRKIQSIQLDGATAVGYIEQSITDFPNSLFPQYQATERPDKVVAGLLEGRMAVILDGTPVALMVPVSFFSFFQALDDFSANWLHGSFLRLLRVASLFTALILPALYIAVTSFHYYAVPLNMLIPLAESRSRVPFPPILEVLILELTVEMVREAAVRLPTYIGTAISVVAGLIIGEAAVDAGVVSNLLIVIVASTAVASYVIPSYDMSLAIRLLRFAFMISASVFGMIGIAVCVSLTLAHLMTLESLGQPYFQPLSPLKPRDLKDTFLRFPLPFHNKRPDIAKPLKKKRGERDNG